MQPEVHQRHELLRRPPPQTHMVQLYGADDQILAKNVAGYFFEGLKLGDGILAIVTPEHNRAIVNGLKELGVDTDASAQEGRIRFLDAEEVLSRFMVGGQPYWGRFESAVGLVVDEIRTQVGHGGLRAYGEMVGVLWKAGQLSAALRLEQFWNKFLTRRSASLFCGYPIDIFANDLQMKAVDALLCAHTHVVPSGSNGDLENAVNSAMEYVLGPPGQDIGTSPDGKPVWAVLPNAEATLWWVRKNLPDCADEILARAREFYHAVP